MKKTYEILDTLRDIILSEHFKNTHRIDEKAFVRTCILAFSTLFFLILNFMRRSLQVELNNFFEKIVPLSPVSKQAFSKARRKILPTAFIDLNGILIKEFYCDNEFKTFQGYRLIIVDGSTLQLPEGDPIKEKYGTCSNQRGEMMNMAQISEAYDPLNEIVLSAFLRPYGTCERSMACEHILKIPPSNCAEDLYLFDRGYPSINLVFFLLFHKKNFVMRCNTAWIAPVTKAVESGKQDVIIEIRPNMLVGEKRKEFQRLLPDVCLNTPVKIRVLVVELCTGEKEILITSLIYKNIFEYEIFKNLYCLRWGGEENYKFHKVRMEIENFSGKTPHAIEQDFHATILVGNIRALLAEEAQRELDQTNRDKNKYSYKINKNIAISTLKYTMVKALFDPKMDLKMFCEQIKKTMKKSTIPIRPERLFPHTRKARRKYPMNARRAL